MAAGAIFEVPVRVATCLAVLLILPATAYAQETPPPGPVIYSAGAAFEISDPDFVTPEGQVYKLAFEMARPAESPEELNVILNSVARYLNMHAMAGVPGDQVRAAVVVHGAAGWEMLGHEAYRAHYGVDNPNVDLIRELTEAGVQVILCGQTAAMRGIPREGLADGVKVALSAMTAFLVLQEEGFRVNPW